MDGQWSVTGPAAHPLTQRDWQIAAGYNHLSMGLNLEGDEDVCMFFTSQGRNTFVTVYSHSAHGLFNLLRKQTWTLTPFHT